MPRHKLISLSFALLLLLSAPSPARAALYGAVQKTKAKRLYSAADAGRDREIAARFAPTFYQG